MSTINQNGIKSHRFERITLFYLKRLPAKLRSSEDLFIFIDKGDRPMKYKRSLLRFALAALLLVTGILMLDNLAAGIFVLFVAAYSLVSGLLWLRADKRQIENPNSEGGRK